MPGRLRSALSWIALAVALGAIGGLFVATQKVYRELLDRSNLSVARTAAAFLSAVTPGAGGRYDPRFDPARLVSGAGALANASFFPGGLQVFFGRTPLLPDTIGFAPLVVSDAGHASDWRVAVPPSGHHVALLAFADRGGGPGGLGRRMGNPSAPRRAASRGLAGNGRIPGGADPRDRALVWRLSRGT
jgi:hypothetical protein